MFRRYIAILLVLALSATSFQQYMVFAGFELNRDYIAKNLCVNRNKPWMHCNGKCYFMRKMKEAQQKEASNDQQTQKNLFQEVYVLPVSVIRFHSHVVAVVNTPYTRYLTPGVRETIFRPPLQA